MDKKQFKTFCAREFESHGFKKHKKDFYLCGKDLLCGIEFQKSNFGNTYYINYYFCLGDFDGVTDMPVIYDSDVGGRIVAMSKTQTIKGKHFLGAAIEYEEYTEEELRPYFDKAFEERILPPIYQGKKYILDNLGRLYSLELHREEVLQKLNS